MSKAQQLESHFREQLGRVLFGLDGAIHQLAVALVAGGHVLVQGPPGLGKTLLAKSFATLLGGRFSRIQGTADLMPADITGVHVFSDGRFELMPGPLFADVVLFDEINRAGPKTQSALLQAMEEGAITIDRTTYPLPQEFLVIAAQNPTEFEGTFPLPESQVDRFLLRIELDYPAPEMEQRVLAAYDRPGGGHAAAAELLPLSAGLLAQAREQAAAVHVDERVYRYALDLAAATRRHPQVSLGISTRGALNLMRCARVEAALAGEGYLTPDHVKAVAPAVVPHRLVLTPDAALDGVDARELVAVLMGQVAVAQE